MDCIDYEGENKMSGKHIIGAVALILSAALLYYCFKNKEVPAEKVALQEPANIPEVWIGPEERCEPEIITVPVERVITKYVEKKIKRGCHVVDGQVFGIMPVDSKYRLECYVQQDNTVKARYIEKQQNEGLLRH